MLSVVKIIQKVKWWVPRAGGRENGKLLFGMYTYIYRYIEFQSNKIKRVMEMDGSDGYTIM